MFRWTAAAGLIAVLFVLLEWWRVSAANRREADTAPTVDAAATTSRDFPIRGEDFAGEIERTEDQNARRCPDCGESVGNAVVGLSPETERPRKLGKLMRVAAVVILDREREDHGGKSAKRR